jgi:hypothetical protein
MKKMETMQKLQNNPKRKKIKRKKPMKNKMILKKINLWLNLMLVTKQKVKSNKNNMMMNGYLFHLIKRKERLFEKKKKNQ